MRIEYRMPDNCYDPTWADTFCDVEDLSLAKNVAQRWFRGCFTSEPPAQVRVLDSNGKTVFELNKEGKITLCNSHQSS